MSIELEPEPFTSDLPMLTFKAKVNNSVSHLSNFYPAVRNYANATTPKPDQTTHLFVHEVDGAFMSVEHMYQYCKMQLVDPEWADTKVRHAATPLLAKQLSGKKAWIDGRYRSVLYPKQTKKWLGERFDERVSVFRHSYALLTMRCALRLKYTQNKELKAALLATGQHPLGELGRMKREWWSKQGTNMLGRLLVELRSELQATEVITRSE